MSITDPHGCGSAGSVKRERMFPSPSPDYDDAKLQCNAGQSAYSYLTLQDPFAAFRIPASAYFFSSPFRQSQLYLSKSAMPPRKAIRRSHRKSRLGCQECKRRHIKVRDLHLERGYLRLYRKQCRYKAC